MGHYGPIVFFDVFLTPEIYVFYVSIKYSHYYAIESCKIGFRSNIRLFVFPKFISLQGQATFLKFSGPFMCAPPSTRMLFCKLFF